VAHGPSGYLTPEPRQAYGIVAIERDVPYA
jgi:hypothetical protein